MSVRRDPDRRHRRSIRLQGFDYAGEGAYFVTICTQNRACLFGDMADGRMRLNVAGQVTEKCWLAIPDHFPHVELDAFVIMPNHVHGIIWIVDSAQMANRGAVGVGAKNFSPLPSSADIAAPFHTTTFRSPSKTLGSIVRGFKIGVTKWIRVNRDIRDVWQRNYFEHIIRDEAALGRIRQYIADNPPRWANDPENPENLRRDRRRQGICREADVVGAKNFSPLRTRMPK